MAMTDDERLIRAEIADRLATCAQAGDAADVDTYAACFTEDAVLALEPPIAGRATIRDWKAAQPGFVATLRHHLTTCRIRLTSADTAEVRTYYLAIGGDRTVNGYYDDRFARVGADWLIAHRQPTTVR